MVTRKIEVYVINLDGSEKRLEDAKKNLCDAGIQFTRVSAIDGREKALTDFSDYDDRTAQKQMGRSLISSELGCYLSHVRCLERFIETTADYLIVFEDDVQLVNDAKNIIDQIIDHLDDNQTLDWYVINISARKQKLYKPVTSFSAHTLNKAYYFPILCLGMIWSRQGAEAFLNTHKSITMPIDNTLQSWLSKIGKGLSVYPPLAIPTGVESDIDGSSSKSGFKRGAKSKRNFFYTYRKQRRLLRDKISAFKHIVKRA